MTDTKDAMTVAALRDQLLAELVGLGSTMSAAMDANPGFVPCGHAFGELVVGLYATVACDDEARLAELVEAVRARSEHVSDHRGVPAGAAVNVRAAIAAAAPAEGDEAMAAGMKAQLLASIQGTSAHVLRAMEQGRMDDEVNVLLANALRALGEGGLGPRDLHGLVRRAGEAAFRAIALEG